MRNQERLKTREAADAIVVGGGVIGLTIARALRVRGVERVLLIESARPGAEASHAAAGMLAPQAEANCADEFFELACASRDLYPAFADALREETGTDIELERTGTLYLAFNEHDEDEIAQRYEWQTRAGLLVERLSAEEARSLEPCISPSLRAALRFPLDVQVENRRLIAALTTSLERHGVELLAETHVKSLVVERGRVEGVETSRGKISAPVVVVACGAWTSFISSSDKATAPEVSIEPVRGQMLCFEMNPRLARHVIYSPRGYIVPRLDGRLLIGSTTERAGFNKRVTAGGINAITTHALEIAPAIENLTLVDSWAGLRPVASDELPVMGACADVHGLFYATAHYRNGILLAPLTGELIAEQITTKITPPMLRAFSPDRFHCVGVS
ncbi:MAG: glycine oxidase [Acidobacteriota bacterium]|jgi:glycine oxidase|nr:glycine oxidase [Acidobacteriota bacterium]